jgi:putative ABC transport system ATP-binding protein
VSHSAANAQPRITEAITGVVDEMGLRPAIERIGLTHQVGPAGRMLTAWQRASVNLVRCLVKRPDILVIDGALAAFGDVHRRELVRWLLARAAEQSLFMVLPNEREIEGFDALIRFEKGKAEIAELAKTAERASAQEGFEAAEAAGKRVAGAVR